MEGNEKELEQMELKGRVWKISKGKRKGWVGHYPVCTRFRLVSHPWTKLRISSDRIFEIDDIAAN